MWFSLPLAFAESCAFVGSVLFTFNLWKTADEPIKNPPATINECINDPMDDRPIAVDIMFPTYDEEPELVALSIRDALNVRYPHEIATRIFILDDGRYPEMAQLAADIG